MAMGPPTRDRRQALADHGIAPGKRRIIEDRSAPVVTAREQYFVCAENRNRQMDPRLSTLDNKWRFKLPERGDFENFVEQTESAVLSLNCTN